MKNPESGTVKLFILVANQFHPTLDSPQPHADCSTTVIYWFRTTRLKLAGTLYPDMA